MSVTCSICTEVFLPTAEVNATPCGHMFHRHCLLRWLEQSQNCPQCRKDCTAARLIKMYLNGTSETNSTGGSSNGGGAANGSLVRKLNRLTLETRNQQQLLTTLRSDAVEHKTQLERMNRSLQSMEEMLRAKNEEALAASRVRTERAEPMTEGITINAFILPTIERTTRLREPSIDRSDLFSFLISNRRPVVRNTVPDVWGRASMNHRFLFDDDDDNFW